MSHTHTHTTYTPQLHKHHIHATYTHTRTYTHTTYHTLHHTHNLKIIERQSKKDKYWFSLKLRVWCEVQEDSKMCTMPIAGVYKAYGAPLSNIPRSSASYGHNTK